MWTMRVKNNNSWKNGMQIITMMTRSRLGLHNKSLKSIRITSQKLIQGSEISTSSIDKQIIDRIWTATNRCMKTPRSRPKNLNTGSIWRTAFIAYKIIPKKSMWPNYWLPERVSCILLIRTYIRTKAIYYWFFGLEIGRAHV